jgi:hypothetical protein
VIDRGVVDDAMAQELPILHQPEQDIPPPNVALDRRCFRPPLF